MMRIVGILMMAAPSTTDCVKIKSDLSNIADVVAVEQLHIWELVTTASQNVTTRSNVNALHENRNGNSNGNNGYVLTCHLLIKKSADSSKILRQALQVCQSHNIGRPTIQVVVVY